MKNDMALAAYKEQHDTATATLKTITEAMDEHSGYATTEIHYGHVGDLTRINELLAQVARIANA